MKYSPIAIFAYNRLHHLQKTVFALLKNPESSFTDLFIFSDFPKLEKDKLNVKSVRAFLTEIKGFKSVTIFERTKNLGLAKSIIDGVNEVFQKFESIIVLEDDIIPSPFFLKYMNDGLKMYDDVNKVGCIHAYTYPGSVSLPETFFLRGADCWGWGTWKSSWKLFEENGQLLLDKLINSNLCNLFDLESHAPFSQILLDQINGEVDSWAIRWHASLFLANKFCLHPGKSLVRNIGLDASGSNCPETDAYNVKLTERPIRVLKNKIEESAVGLNNLKRFFSKIHSHSPSPE